MRPSHAASSKLPEDGSQWFHRRRSRHFGWIFKELLSNQGSLVDTISLWFTLASLLIAVAVALIVPILAFTWAAKPFPGFVVEQTGVIADYGGLRWSGRQSGLSYPERVVEIDNMPIHTLADFDEALQDRTIGQLIQVRIQRPDGSEALYKQVIMRPFLSQDFFRLFWLPYATGLVFLLLGGWVFLVRGDTRPGRAFAFFCVSASISTLLLFDLITTHTFSAAWTIAIAQVGGSLFSLAMLFPEEWAPVQRHAWVRFLPFIGSIYLASWGLAQLHNLQDPWAYIQPWRYSYIYLALGILTFLVMMVYRVRTHISPVARQQARIILWGGALSFIPLAVWLVAPVFGVLIPWNTLLYLPLLILFPLSTGLAILRYRLWDVDVIINRTLVYSALTLFLGLIYAASVLLFEQLFSPFLGRNQLATVVATLAIVALFNPLRLRIQDFIDSRFYRRKYNMAQTLAAFAQSLRDEVDLERLTWRLEEVIWETMQPSHIFTWLPTSTGYSIQLASEHLQPGERVESEIQLQDPLVPALRLAAGALELESLDLDSPAVRRLTAANVRILLPLVSQGELMGWLSLGPRLSERGYSADDRSLLTNLTVQAAPAVRVAQLVRREQAQALERERLEHEMNLAREIQLALLPKELPSLMEWRVAAHYQPAREVGGDFYDFIYLPDGRLGLVIGDVTGKGVPAALVMATTRSVLRAVALQGLPPGQVLQLANTQLELDIPSNMFVTCLYAVLEPAAGRMRYANAGQNLPLLRSGSRVEELRAYGMPLGLMADMSYEEREAVLKPGDSLLLYSDGLTEAHSPDRVMFGSQRLRQLVAGQAGAGEGMIQCLLAELKTFTGPDWEQEDDITMVMVKRFSERRP